MYPPPQGYSRNTSPKRQHLGVPPPPPLPEEIVGIRFETETEMRLHDELRHKEAVLKQLEVQFELYKEEHAKLLASKLEEQREAFNLEKDRINQHFIKTGQELHTKTEELQNQHQDASKLQNENQLLKEWLDRGVEECKRVADENEKIKAELWEAKSALNKNDGDIRQRIAAAEMEREKEKAEKEAAHSALQALQEKIREMEVAADEDKKNFMELATQARRMRRRLLQLRGIIDRFTGERVVDPLAGLDDIDMTGDLDAPVTVADRQTARDAMFHLHEALNTLQSSCRALFQEGPGGSGGIEYNSLTPFGGPGAPPHGQPQENPSPPLMGGLHSLRQQVEMLTADNETLQNQLKRKTAELEELEEERISTRRRQDQQRQELEDEVDNQRRLKNQMTMEGDAARNEANRLRDELEQNRFALSKLQEQAEASERRAADLEEDLRKLTQEMAQIRDYGLQLEQQNEDLQRQLTSHKESGDKANDLTNQLQRQIEEQKVQYQALQDQLEATKKQQAAQLQQQQQQPVAQVHHGPTVTVGGVASSTPQGGATGIVTPVVAGQPPAQLHTSAMSWPVDPDDYGHASNYHVKLTCPLCSTSGFVPGVPCRNCGHSIGQFTRLVPSQAQPSQQQQQQQPYIPTSQHQPTHSSTLSPRRY
eukprot:TRINITY_DN27413_c0_g1_i1.p1 TRINITY_DN27413_c0_g1~~TRINITY_DN27413_c0_g1_i1.p1  ORF type:complete len:670 (+),score=163.03 TRINITY_DN27413_c0_g1_i1:59-2011(+)